MAIMGRVRRAIRRIHIEKYLDDRNVVLIGATITALSMIIFGALPIIIRDSDLVGAIGDYLSGVGQMIIFIWILVTFWLQRSAAITQRDEQIRQDRSNQQRNIIPVFEIHRGELELLTRRFVRASLSQEKLDKKEAPSRQDEPYPYIRYLLHNVADQEALANKFQGGDESAIIFVERYCARFETLRNAILEVDISNHLHDALISQTDYSDLYFMLRTLRQTLA